MLHIHNPSGSVPHLLEEHFEGALAVKPDRNRQGKITSLDVQ